MNAGDDGTHTYEATMARKSNHHQADRIHWECDAAFRDNPYRQLHHQKGLVGNFKVRLLEAAGLERNYWSLLGVGAMKHLGLSKAHGSVSSYCTFSLASEPHAAVQANPTECLSSPFSHRDGKIPATNAKKNNRSISEKNLSQPVAVIRSLTDGHKQEPNTYR